MGPRVQDLDAMLARNLIEPLMRCEELQSKQRVRVETLAAKGRCDTAHVETLRAD